MNITYIAPSVMPSRSANSIHVARMCHAFNASGYSIALFIKRSTPEGEGVRQQIEDFYGVRLDKTRVISFHSRNKYATNIRIAAMALLYLLRIPDVDFVLSRNLYASYVLSCISSRPLIFETHQLEYGFRKKIQGSVMGHPRTHTVVISNALLNHLKNHHGFYPAAPIILPDGAPSGICPLSESEKQIAIRQIAPQACKPNFYSRVGYFGHLYQGRGIGIIQALAERHPDIAFLIFGGNDNDIRALMHTNNPPNFYVMGYMAPAASHRTMAAMDVLLMPYQKKVSIGVSGHDTSSWMSPMKMFEYMAVGVPLIASDLPAFSEILRDRENCLLAKSDDPNAWSSCLNLLRNDPNFGATIGMQAHRDYTKNYTWDIRARRMIDFITR